jgi:capsid protein
MRTPWRHNQGRGIPALLTPAANFADLYEILAASLQSAKRTAKQYAYIKRADAVTDWDSPTGTPERLPENDGKSAADVAAEGANSSTEPEARNYESLETFTSGLTDYMQPGDTVVIPAQEHPNPVLKDYMDAVHGFSGAALGLASAYTRMRADSSYTAFRGDMIMTWVTFYWLQKRLERLACDWVARKALAWGMRRRAFGALPVGWERSLSWTWPRMPEVNESDAEQAVAAKLKNGTTTYSALLGPDWRQRLASLAEEVNEIRRLLLPLGILETTAGAAPAKEGKGQQ